MNESQKKALGGALQMLAAGAHRGRRIIDGGGTLEDVRRHVDDLDRLVRAMKESIGNAIDAAALLEHVAHRKGLS